MHQYQAKCRLLFAWLPPTSQGIFSQCCKVRANIVAPWCSGLGMLRLLQDLGWTPTVPLVQTWCKVFFSYRNALSHDRVSHHVAFGFSAADDFW